MKLRLLFVAAGLTAAWVSCTPGQRAATAQRPSVVMLIADGWRADHTAMLDELRARFFGSPSFEFVRAYAPSSLAEQSLASVFTGRLPTYGGGIGLAEAQPSEQALTLATSFRTAGYKTGLVSQQPWAARPGFTRGFSDLQVAVDQPWTDEEVAHKAMQVLEDWTNLEKRAGDKPRQPTFLVVHWAAPTILNGGSESAPDQIRALYQEELSSRVHLFSQLLESMEAAGALDKTVVVFTSGHGYELDEHGAFGTGWTLHEEVTRVPLLIRSPQPAPPPDSAGQTDSQQTTHPISTVRLAATLRMLAGIYGDQGGDGEAEQRPLVTAQPTGAGPLVDQTVDQRPVISELVVRERLISRAVIEATSSGNVAELLKYLHQQRDIPIVDRPALAQGYEELQAAMLAGKVPTPPLFGSAVKEQLFRLSTDPTDLKEQLILPTESAQRLTHMRAVLRDYKALCEAGAWPPPQLTERLEFNPEDAKQLESLGYL